MMSNFSTVDSLSSELLLKIFDNLNYKNVKNCTLVSKHWNALISEWDKFLGSTVVNLYGNDEKFKSAKFSRKYQSLKMYCSNPNPHFECNYEEDIKFNSRPFPLPFYGNLRSLKMCCCSFHGDDFVNLLLRHCEHLEELDLSHVKKSTDKSTVSLKNSDMKLWKISQVFKPLTKSSAKFQLKKLKKLYICSSNSVQSEWMLKNLKNCRELDILKIHHEEFCRTSSYPAIQVLIGFLNQLTHCEKLELIGVDLGVASTINEFSMDLDLKFRWKCLILKRIRVSYFRPQSSSWNWKILMKASEEKSELTWYDCNMPLQIMNKCVNMSKLKFDIGRGFVTVAELFAANLKPMPQVKFLKIRSSFFYHENNEECTKFGPAGAGSSYMNCMKMLLDVATGVESLHIKSNYLKNQFTHILRLINNGHSLVRTVKNLKIDLFPEYMRMIRFPLLEYVEISQMNFSEISMMALKRFSQNHVNLKRAKFFVNGISHEYELKFLFIALHLTMINLKIIEIFNMESKTVYVEPRMNIQDRIGWIRNRKVDFERWLMRVELHKGYCDFYLNVLYRYLHNMHPNITE